MSDVNLGSLTEALGLRSVRVLKRGNAGVCCSVERNGIRLFLKASHLLERDRILAEYSGLQALRLATEQSSYLRVPNIHEVGEDQEVAFMLTEWIDSETSGQVSETKLGLGLAELHLGVVASSKTEQANRYGLATDNYIGDTAQSNRQHVSWQAFFLEERLRPMVDRIRSSGYWESSWDESWQALQIRIPQLLPDRPPVSVLHGDLWNGNAIASAGGYWYLIDPAYYLGHAETDLAMMRLFGGFSRTVFDAYDSVLVPDPGRAEREG
ncbi:MAG: phosphotransferase, partial [Rhodothermales bacterium]|nr:phosphotransferase [Rhodothermales bacterium]